jgi:hypothetical protein
MHEIIALFAIILFVLLTPGVLLRLPQKGPIIYSAIVHGIIFVILLYLISKISYQYLYRVESFENEDPSPEPVHNTSINGRNCNEQNCDRAIKSAIKKGNPVITKWWDDGEGCSGCSIPSNVVVIPDPNKGVKPINPRLDYSNEDDDDGDF